LAANDYHKNTNKLFEFKIMSTASAEKISHLLRLDKKFTNRENMNPTTTPNIEIELKDALERERKLKT
jgi:hypothetical protein